MRNPARSAMRLIAILTVTALLAAPLGTASFPTAPEAALLEKADPALAVALQRGEPGPLAVIVTGPEHPAALLEGVTDRADARARLAEAAAPFVEGVTRAAALQGARVTGVWEAAPAVAVLADAPALAVLAARGDVRALTLDREGSVRVLDGAEEPGRENTGGRRMLQAEEIWALGFMGEGVRLSVVGTGVDATHEAFKHANGSSRIAAWRDLVNNGPAPYDDNGHSTHMAGTAAGSSDYVDPTWGAFQEAGVAPHATLLAVKFLTGAGSGSFEGAMSALQWSYDQGADVALNGWGASSCGVSTLPILQMLRTLTAGGMVSVFGVGAGGPGAGTVGAPACSEPVISVGAVDTTGNITSFSSRGPCSDPDAGTGSRVCPDLVAKGALVRSAAPRSGASGSDPSGYRILSGSNMAAAGVAGAVVLIEQMKRHYTGEGWNTSARAEEEVLKLTALDLGPEGPDDAYGWGLPQLLNVHALLDASEEPLFATTFGIGKAVLGDGDTSELSFRVRNLGNATASGTFTVTLAAPDGTTRTLDEREASLGLLGTAGFTTVFAATGSTPAGTYTFAGRFAYTWTNATTGEVRTGLVERAGAFDVRRVVIHLDVDGYEPKAMPLTPQRWDVTLTNVGNAVGRDVSVELTLPDDYLLLPLDGADPMNPNSRYATPAPDSVREDRTFGRVTLLWSAHDLAPGDAFSVRLHPTATTPGTYRTCIAVKYADERNVFSGQGACMSQQAGLG